VAASPAVAEEEVAVVAAERPGASGPMRTVDIVVTTLLAIVACLIGLVYGYFALVLTPTSSVAVWWVIVSVLMMLVPVATTIWGIQRIRAGRTGFWMPLLGAVVVVALIAVLAALSTSL
jgi:hypothetical protein